MTAIAPQIPDSQGQSQVALHCIRCGRPLKHASATGMGPKCAKAVKAAPPNLAQAELFPHLWARVQSAIRRAHVWLGGAA